MKTKTPPRVLQTNHAFKFKKKTTPLGVENWIFLGVRKVRGLTPKSEKFDYTCITDIKFFEFLVVIPVMFLSPQVRIKKTPPGFEKKGPQKKSLPYLENFSLFFINILKKIERNFSCGLADSLFSH